MKQSVRNLVWVLVLLLGTILMAKGQGVVINEIMHHPLQPQFAPEPIGEEFIELYNRGATNVNLNGWRFNKGISFTFTNIVLPAGGYLVVSPDTNAFLSHYGAIPGAILIGNWTGTLGNNGETIELKDAAGDVVDSIPYATEGDWAIRRRGPDDLTKRGWKWYCEADGLGKSMERRNPSLPGDNGQNWRFSAVINGTPGRANAALTNNVAPLILNLAHSPAVPRSTQTVAVTAKILDEVTSGLAVTLFYSVNPATSPADFSSASMFDDGLHGDGVANDGVFGAILPAQANNTIVEFYVQAADAGGRTSTWPGSVMAAADATGPTGQVANALYQVDNDVQNDFGVLTPSQPVCKLIMTASENTELAGIPCTGSQNSDAEMNGTFIAMDGISTEVRYRCGFRNRGHGSRCTTPPNYRVNVPNDQLWKNQAALNFNAVNTPAQVLGATLAKKAGMAGADSRAAQVRVNNLNRASTGTGMLGSYALNEEIGTEWANQHFPLDSGGNAYRAIRDIAPSEWAYRGPLVSSYVNTYFKTDNSSAYDWSDLIQLHRIVGTNDLFTTANVRQVANIEEWCLYYAIMSMEGNTETSPNTGYNDDYFMYRGVNDPRFLLLYYDNDSILSTTYFQAGSTGAGIFTAEANNGMGAMTTRFLEWPDFKPIYYATLQRLITTTYGQPEFDAIVDEVMNTYPSGSSRENVRSSVKSYMAARRATVQSLINGLVPPATNNPVAVVTGEPRTPTPFNTATLTVSGSGITHYKWKLNNGAYSAEAPVATSISISGLANGSTNTVSVVGRNSSGIYQDTTNATVSRIWVVRSSTPTVRLNEILALNVAAANHNGTFPDIIELYNEGGSTVDLAGLRLTDDPSNPGAYTFPGGTTLAAGAYLILYANNPDATPGIHLGFSLNQDGDSVYLFDRATNGNIVLDSVTFGVQLADKSIGRFANGDWLLCQPSIGAANVAQAMGGSTTLKLNEWLAASGALPFVNDFIEVYNPDPLPVAMGGMHLTDEPIGAPALHRIANLSFIAGGGYLSFTADGNEGADASHLNFQLDADIGEIGLLDALLSKIDCVSYGPQRPGVSMGRCPDGSVTNITLLSFPTPGVGNSCPTPPPAPITVTLLNYTNVWRYNSNNVEALNWKAPGFDDSTWLAGPGVLGNGGTPPEPVLTPLASPGRTSYYFRCTFNMPTNASFSSMQITHIIDDGAAIYVNGLEAYRFNLSTIPLLNSTFAAPTVSGTPPYQGPFSFPFTNFVAGTNTLAVEVHQATFTSPDIFFGMKLEGIIVTNSPGSAGVVINEVFARNGTVAEPDGTTPDWVEIYNPAMTAVDLGDASLSDSTLNSRRWVFPVPTILPAQSYYSVRFDSGAPASTTNTGFGLKSSGDSVYLFKKPADGGGVLDQINFGIQLEDFSIGRVPSGSTNWQLTVPSARAANTAAPTNDASGLRINEWMAQPASGDDWFEVYNSAAQPVNLGGLWLSDNLASIGTRQQFRVQNLSFIGTATNAFIRFWADNNLAAGADHVNFKLAGSGEEIGVSSADGTLINGVLFFQQDIGVSEGRLPDGATNIVRFPNTASPGEANYLLLPGIFINEALTHTDLPLEDAIELQNTSGAGINLSGWYLSDSKSHLKKYTIANGTTINPGLFKVFYEYQFNDVNFPGTAFSLSSSKGDEVYLSQATNGTLTGYRAVAKFGPSANGVSFGRYANSQGVVDYVAMSALSLGTAVTAQSPTNQITVFRTGVGATNPYPKVGPVIINEVMYHPPDIIVPGVSTNDNTIEEFIELKNISALTVPLYDPAHSTNGWRLRDAVDFTFTTAHSIPPGGHLIVVSFDPLTNSAALAQFRSKYGSNYVLAGPWSGKLDNSSESVELVRPDNPQPDGDVPQILVEKVVYQDKAPWPTNADGLGQSLQRRIASGYANDVTNWLAALPALGPFGDTDGDGMPDDWEMANGLNKNFAGDAGLDPDLDGMTNLQEYLAGTNPQSAASVLRLTATLNAGGVDLTFSAVAGRTYSILYANSMPSGGNWQWLTNVPAQGVTGVFTVRDVSNQTGVQRYYRIITPALP